MSINKRNSELAIRLPAPSTMTVCRRGLREPQLSHRGDPMIESLLPAAACSEMFSDALESTMFSVEAAVVASADVDRRREFGTVRYCARQALRKIGVPAVPILPDADGAPRWPVGVVGSMTHCTGYRAAVVARSRELRSVGIDAEPDAALPAVMLDLILRDEECVELCALADALPDRHWDRILFCAKEAVFKAWFPIARSWLDFLDVSVTVRPGGTFSAFVHASSVAGIGPRFDGRWTTAVGVIVAATSVSRSPSGASRRVALGDSRPGRDSFREALV